MKKNSVIFATFFISVLFVVNIMGCSSPIKIYNELSQPVTAIIVPEDKENAVQYHNIPFTHDPIAPYASQTIQTVLGRPAYSVLFKIGNSKTHLAPIGHIQAGSELIIGMQDGVPSVGVKIKPRPQSCSLHVAMVNNPLKRDEDRWIIDNHNPRYDFFGVFDGHGGSQVAEELKKHIISFITERICLGHSIEQALEQAFEQLERLVCLRQEVYEVRGKKRKACVGSCALLVIIDKRKKIIYTANIGDSRALLVEDGTETALSSDHKPERPEETDRITKAGATLRPTRGEGAARIPARVDGILAVSRAIGDYHIKCKHPGAIIAQPEITTHSIQPVDKALVLACDGIWDVLDNKTASTIVRQQMPDPLKAAQELVTQAAQRGSRDDLTAMVIAIEHHKI
jgi:serine/threonine protein phosphatase PrpC